MVVVLLLLMVVFTATVRVVVVVGGGCVGRGGGGVGVVADVVVVTATHTGSAPEDLYTTRPKLRARKKTTTDKRRGHAVACWMRRAKHFSFSIMGTYAMRCGARMIT